MAKLYSSMADDAPADASAIVTKIHELYKVRNAVM